MSDSKKYEITTEDILKIKTLAQKYFQETNALSLNKKLRNDAGFLACCYTKAVADILKTKGLLEETISFKE